MIGPDRLAPSPSIRAAPPKPPYRARNSRSLGLPNRIKSWSLTSLQHKPMRYSGRPCVP